jgi:hypothetical protein
VGDGSWAAPHGGKVCVCGGGRGQRGGRATRRGRQRPDRSAHGWRARWSRATDAKIGEGDADERAPT